MYDVQAYSIKNSSTNSHAYSSPHFAECMQKIPQGIPMVKEW